MGSCLSYLPCASKVLFHHSLIMLGGGGGVWVREIRSCRSTIGVLMFGNRGCFR